LDAEKGEVASFSISMVKLTAEWAWLRVSRKSAALGISGSIVNISAVIRRQFAFQL